MGKATQGTSPRTQAGLKKCRRGPNIAAGFGGTPADWEHGLCHDVAYVVQADMW